MSVELFNRLVRYDQSGTVEEDTYQLVFLFILQMVSLNDCLKRNVKCLWVKDAQGWHRQNLWYWQRKIKQGHGMFSRSSVRTWAHILARYKRSKNAANFVEWRDVLNCAECASSGVCKGITGCKTGLLHKNSKVARWGSTTRRPYCTSTGRRLYRVELLIPETVVNRCIIAHKVLKGVINFFRNQKHRYFWSLAFSPFWYFPFQCLLNCFCITTRTRPAWFKWYGGFEISHDWKYVSTACKQEITLTRVNCQ